MIRSFKNLFVEPNINNAQSASFGYKGLKDVVQCLVDAGRNFATTVAALGAHMGAALILDRQILSTIYSLLEVCLDDDFLNSFLSLLVFLFLSLI